MISSNVVVVVTINTLEISFNDIMQINIIMEK
jgi:hypothetical protein